MPVQFNSFLQLLTKSSRISEVISPLAIRNYTFSELPLVLLLCTRGRSALTISCSPGFTETSCELSGGYPATFNAQCQCKNSALFYALFQLTVRNSNSLICVDMMENIKHKKKDTNQKGFCACNDEFLKSQHLILFLPCQTKTIVKSIEN